MTSTETRSDFGDWLSPMLVKELRQGMRSKIFMAAFYLTQLLMILCVIFNLSLASNTDTQIPLQGFLNGLFWFMISVPLLFVMPIRGFGALHGEMKAGTLELVFLTRLTAWRIAFGKWTAIVVQTLLLVCAILPYVLLRYFLGGVDILADLQSVVFLLLASGALTAVTIAISPYESKLLRALFVLGLIIGFQFLIGLIFAWAASSSFGGTAGRSMAGWPVYAGLAVFLPAFLFLALEIAASRIAPPAENHALRKRLVGWYLVVVAPFFLLAGANTEAVFGVMVFFLAVVLIDALAEPVVTVRSLYDPFLRRGLIGRLGALLFTPGWVSAAWFATVTSVLVTVLLVWQGQFNEPRSALAYVSFLGAVVFPAALIRVFQPESPFFLGFYIALQFLLTALTVLVSMVSGISGDSVTVWLCIFPNSAFLLNTFDGIEAGHLTLFLTASSFVTVASLAVLIIRTFAPLRDIRVKMGN